MGGHDVEIKGADGPFSAYQAGGGPAVLVIQEIFGVNHVMRDLVDGLADQGYCAICPDLFWRIEPGIQLTDKSEAEWKRAFELYQAFDRDLGVKDIQSTIDYARQIGTGKVGAVGYCLGGHMAYLTACRTDADCAVGYYGVSIQNALEDANTLSRPLMLHIAGQDQFVDADAQRAIMDGLGDHPQVTLHHYPDQDHAFARKGGEHFDAQAADLANGRTRQFLQEHLR